MVGKRTDRVQSVDLGIARTGWESLPPRDRVEKRSAAGRVVGLSENAKRSQRKEGAQRKSFRKSFRRRPIRMTSSSICAFQRIDYIKVVEIIIRCQPLRQYDICHVFLSCMGAIEVGSLQLSACTRCQAREGMKQAHRNQSP